MVKLGINTGLWSYARHSLNEAFEDISHLGIRYIDLFTRLNCDPTTMTVEQMKELKRQIENHNLIVSSLCTVLPTNFLINSDHKMHCLSYIRKNFELAEIADTRLVLIKNGQKVLGKQYGQCWSESLEFMRNICEEAKKRDFIMILEMEPTVHSLTNSVATIVSYLHDLQADNFLVNIDIGHFFIVKDGPVELKELSDYIAHIHITDNEGLNDTNDILGTGQVPITAYIDSCLEANMESTCRKHEVLPVAAVELGSFRRTVYQPRVEAKMSLEFLREHAPFWS